MWLEELGALTSQVSNLVTELRSIQSSLKAIEVTQARHTLALAQIEQGITQTLAAVNAGQSDIIAQMKENQVMSQAAIDALTTELSTDEATISTALTDIATAVTAVAAEIKALAAASSPDLTAITAQATGLDTVAAAVTAAAASVAGLETPAP